MALELLSDLGFDTTLSSDRDARRLARDLEGVVDDAEGADVAVLFYAGQGIEAGGENWLVPTDAAIAALDDAAAKLVPMSQIVSDLRSKVADTSLAGVSPQDRERMGRGLAESQAGVQ